MFDIGIGEIIVLAAIGLLVFGPERLPKAAGDAAKWVKQIRQMAANAKSDLADSAGVDFKETIDSMKSLTDLHPRKLAADLMRDEPTAQAKPAQGTGSAASATGGWCRPFARPWRMPLRRAAAAFAIMYTATGAPAAGLGNLSDHNGALVA